MQYKPLMGDMDDIPLMSGDEADSDREVEGGGESSEGETLIFEQIGGRQRWQRRIRARSTLFNLICDGGWQIMLKK